MATAKIQILSDGPMRGTSFALTNESYTIGRTENCDICISDTTISGHHCTLLHPEEGVYYLRDEGSTNGTRVNSEKLEPGQEVELNQGDIFQVGGIEILFDKGDYAARTEYTATKINLEDTGTGEVTSTAMKNMSGGKGTKRPVMLRDNQSHNIIMMLVIGLLAIVAIVALVLVVLRMH